MEPLKAFQQGIWHSSKPLILGSTSDEIYVPAYWPITLNQQLYEVRYLSYQHTFQEMIHFNCGHKLHKVQLHLRETTCGFYGVFVQQQAIC